MLIIHLIGIGFLTVSCRLQLPALALSPSQQMQELCWQGEGMSLPDAMQGCESPSPRADSSLAVLTALLSESFCFTAKKTPVSAAGTKISVRAACIPHPPTNLVCQPAPKQLCQQKWGGKGRKPAAGTA